MSTKKSMDRKLNEIISSVKRLMEVKRNINQAMAEAKAIERKETLNISNWMYSNLSENEESFEIETNPFSVSSETSQRVRCTKVRTKRITWDTDKLKKSLDKKTYNEVVNKKVIITDMEGLVKYLKSCDVDPKKFKKFIIAEHEVNEEAMNQKFQTGDLSLSDLSGCYTLKLGEPYIRITELKQNEV